ncbi:methyltransferase domain-containing protein [Thioalkalivibrio paradoxus]|uniref:Methyltransferase domain-containing protein n=1 Tax=Thioalkalivibrio paradoxus ARh 1 TaxID=713585 RepID=W0DT64_9GAMM|nr:methyltransferase domain-containing protein [Thioalkalivibrio paradoxus]AHF00154.1 hypothetical protein THITH_10565 [Thioalkalivibrio paradoxus ARh 1]
MKCHDHSALRGHIPPETFDVQERERWRQTRYLEALAEHHRHSTDRSDLLHAIGALFEALEQLGRGFRQSAPTAILDVGCGNGEVASRLLRMLSARCAIDYLGMDIDARMLKEARSHLMAQTPTGSRAVLRLADYRDRTCWDALADHAFDFVWMVHSGYYLSHGHTAFLQRLSSLLTPDGLAVLIHNPEGNAPFLAAARTVDLQCDALRFRREIVVPTISPAVYEAMATDPEDLDAFSRTFQATPAARALRLMLEFYLPEYPLEALPADARSTYVRQWQHHLASEQNRFSNQHEMVLLWARGYPHETRKQLVTTLRGVLAHE